MRPLILLLLFAASLLNLSVAERVTVLKLEKAISANAAKHSTNSSGQIRKNDEDIDLLQQLAEDDDFVRQLDAMELTERLTPAARARLVDLYKPGPHVQQSLERLADRSGLLDPPSSEIPNLPPPNPAAQRRMLVLANRYVFNVLSHLPNFFATRSTSRFDDSPFTIAFKDAEPSKELHLVGSSTREITFQDGKEVTNSMQAKRASSSPEAGLASHGEFGPEAAIVLFDLGNSTLDFHHWEHTLGGLAAVYRYTVPRSGSHYEVNYGCMPISTFHDTPGYHGELAIAPDTGAMLRITVVTDGKKSDPISHVASVIEYGPVELGNRRYVCPLRSIAFTVEEVNVCARKAHDRKLPRPITMLNRTTFTDYHRLGSSSRVILDKDQDATSPQPAKPNNTDNSPESNVPMPKDPN